MRLHWEGDHPADVAGRVRQALRYLSVSLPATPELCALLGRDELQGLGWLLQALEESAAYLESSHAGSPGATPTT